MGDRRVISMISIIICNQWLVTGVLVSVGHYMYRHSNVVRDLEDEVPA